MADGKFFSTAYLGKKLLVAQNLKSFEVVYDIENILPKGVLTINDPNGNFLRKFEGLEIGSEFELECVPADKNGERFSFGKMVNIGIGDNPIDNLAFQGEIEVLLGHSWQLYKNFETHIYKGIPNSEIIKKILDERNSLFLENKIEYDSDGLKSSDEDGKIPRYCCGLSDFDFIKKRLLPYTTIMSSPTFFWINEEGKARLDCFENLIQQNPKALLIPKSTGNTEADKDSIAFLLDKTVSKNLVLYENLLIKVGDEDIKKLISPLRFKAEIDGNTILGTAFEGFMRPKLKVGDDTSSNVGSKYPILAWTMNDATTDIKVFSNRNANDVKSFSINSTRQFINMFRVEFSTSFCGDSVHVGDTVLVYAKKSQNGEEDKLLSHWISDKWLVSKVRHYYSNRDTNLYSQLTLCRPTFFVAKNKTEMPNIDFYYGD